MYVCTYSCLVFKVYFCQNKISPQFSLFRDKTPHVGRPRISCKADNPSSDKREFLLFILLLLFYSLMIKTLPTILKLFPTKLSNLNFAHTLFEKYNTMGCDRIQTTIPKIRAKARECKN